VHHSIILESDGADQRVQKAAESVAKPSGSPRPRSGPDLPLEENQKSGLLNTDGEMKFAGHRNRPKPALS
jgi:hypothetical protein